MLEAVVERLLKLNRGHQGGAAPAITIQCKNTSGGALARGDVVVFDRTNSTHNLICVTTTTSGNDIDVVGMVYNAVLGQDLVGPIQIWGPTKYLKANGVTNIAVGDMLGTFTTAKIAAVSTTGGRFARAMEAYTTDDSAGVIDAFITNMNLGGFTTE
jgi:hypothetical protein